MESQEASALQARSRLTDIVSRVETPKHLETVLERCTECDKFRYEVMMPEQICLTCAYNQNLNDIMNILKVRKQIILDDSDEENVKKNPVSCYLAKNGVKVGDYIGVLEASELLGVSRSCVYVSMNAKRPTGAYSVALDCKVYFRKMEVISN